MAPYIEMRVCRRQLVEHATVFDSLDMGAISQESKIGMHFRQRKQSMPVKPTVQFHTRYDAREPSSPPRAKAIAREEQTSLLRMMLGSGLLMLMAALCMMILGAGRAAAAEPVRILAFGDSLSAGYQLPADAGFVPQLQKRLDEEGLETEVLNAAVSGDTTSNGLSRLDWSTPENVDLVLLELGANDALQGLSVPRAKENLAEMIKQFRAKDAKVLLLGMRAPPNMGEDYVSEFDAIYPALAKEFDVALVPFFLEDVAGQPQLNLDDGMHPNEEGIRIIVNNVAPSVVDIVKTLQ